MPSPHSSDSTPDASRGSGTRLRRPPGIWLLVLGLIVLGAGTLLAILLLMGDETDMEEQPEPQSTAVVARQDG